MITLDRIRKISTIGLPIIGGMISSVILGLVDTAMVSTLGNAALGAVGFSSFAAFIYLGFFYGFSIAVQATVSRRKGEKKQNESGVYLTSAVLIIAISAPIFSIILYQLTPYLYPLVNNDPEVIRIGIDYIRWLILQALFVGFIAANTGFWNGAGLSRIYIPSLLLMHASNILFNYIFIFGHFGALKMGAEGAGFATALSAVFGSILFLRLGLANGKPFGYFARLPTWMEHKQVFRLAIPAGLQQFLDITALTLTYGIVGSIGTKELACYAVLVNFIGLVGLPGWGLGTAGATLVGHSLGERKPEEAAEWAWDVIKIGAVGMFIMGMPFWIFPDQILSIWIHDAATREIGIWPTRILGFMIGINGIGYMFSMMLNGAGDVKRVTWVNLITQWGLLVPGAYLFGMELGYGLLGIWCVHQFAYRGGHAFIFSYFWKKGDWAKIII